MTVVRSTDYLTEVQKGLVGSYSMVHKFGKNEAVPNGTWEFVNSLGFTGWPLSAATTVRVKAGGSVNDVDTSGSHAHTITVQGIDSNLDEVSEDVNLAGASASGATTASFWRVHRAWVKEVGTYGNANDTSIVIENSGGGTDLIQIDAGEGQTQFCAYTIPNLFEGYLTSIHFTVDTTKACDFRLMTRGKIDTTSSPNILSPRVKLFFAGVDVPYTYRPTGPGLVIDENTDVWIEARGNGGTASVSANMEILLQDKN